MGRLPVLLAATAIFSPLAEALNYFKGLNTVKDLESVGILDKNGVLSKATMLSFSNAKCDGEVKALGFPQDYFDLPDAIYETGQVQFAESGDRNELVKMFGVSSCDTFVYLPAGSKITDFEKKIPDGSADLHDWFWAKHRVPKLKVMNDMTFPVSVLWDGRTGGGKARHVMTLEQGKSANLDTFLGHTFIFRDNKERFLARRVVTSREPLNISKLVYACDNVDCEKGDTEVLQRNEEDARLWKARLSANLGRLRQCENQPPQYKRYTPVGFKKMSFPEKSWKQVQEFWNHNKHVQLMEPWSRDDTHVNFWSSHTTMTYINEPIRQTMFNTLRPILEDWSGIKLDPTSSYGIRTYYNGSWLRDHADKGQTHIVSAILNVDQDTDEPWPLHILDRNGDRHLVTMKPGDLVLYESAVAIHGRPMPFTGRTYSGIFSHFRPLEWANQSLDEEEEEEGLTQTE